MPVLTAKERRHADLPLRGPDVLELFRAVARGAPVHPVSLLVKEGTPRGATM